MTAARPSFADERIDISVIVPAYNSAIYIEECLRSVVAAMPPKVAWEALVVDDASSDDTLRIAQTVAAGEERFQVFAQKSNKGVSAARNRGIANARGRWLLFLDSDDELEADSLAELITTADRQSLDVLYFDAAPRIDMPTPPASEADYSAHYRRPALYETPQRGTYLALRMLREDHWRTSACLQITRRGLIEENHIRFPVGLLHEDNWVSTRVAMCARRAAHVSTPLYRRRIRPGSITTGATTHRHLASLIELSRAFARKARHLDGNSREFAEQMSARMASDAELTRTKIPANTSFSKASWYAMRARMRLRLRAA